MVKSVLSRVHSHAPNNGPPTAVHRPYSPSYSPRRVWVKRIGRTPTTIFVHPSDIVDDLKLAVCSKFPTTLARQFDPSDLNIRLDLLLRHLADSHGDLQSQKSPQGRSQTAEKPPLRKSGSSSHSVNRLALLPEITSKSPNLATLNLAPTHINLEPDQNVWMLLETYFPNGMAMGEALLVETPALGPHDAHNVHLGVYYTAKNNQLAAAYHNNLALHEQHQFSQLHDKNAPNHRNSGSGSALGPLAGLSLTPVFLENANVVGSPAPGQYHHPKPRYLNQNSTLALNSALNADRLVSPSAPLKSSSPVAAATHRRSYSNPPISPVPVTLVGSNGTNGTASTAKGNGQAVLLLPKNFSLATGSSGTSVDKKRLSFDDSYIRKNKSNPDPLKPTSLLGDSLSTIQSNSASPFPAISTSLQELEAERGDSASAHARESSATLTPGSARDGLSVSPSPPPPQMNDRLNSPSNDVATNAASVLNISSPKEEVLGTSKDHEKPVEKKPAPLHKRSSDSVKPPKTATEKVLPSISVLVVEDNAINQAILGAFLRKHKIHYQIAKNGQEAIDKWRNGGFHLVLMDIQLPVKSGIEATKEIRHLERINRIGVFAQHEPGLAKNLPELTDDQKLDVTLFRSPVIIVALTASSNSSVDRKNALTAGCNDFLTKPVNLVWLQNKITEWGCMQALIDFDGWRFRGRAPGVHRKTSDKKPEQKPAKIAA